MFRFIVPIILIGTSIAGFFLFIKPNYEKINDLSKSVVSYNEALTNSKSLENERDKITKKYNSINTTNLDKLEKMLPDGVDNIRLILEIDKLAHPYGMSLKEIKYDSLEKDEANTENVVQGGESVKETNKNYGVWNLGFSIEGSYTNFLSFVKDLEKNLRIVDIVSIDFSSTDVSSGKKQKEIYKYTFNIKTYWLKN